MSWPAVGNPDTWDVASSVNCGHPAVARFAAWAFNSLYAGSTCRRTPLFPWFETLRAATIIFLVVSGVWCLPEDGDLTSWTWNGPDGLAHFGPRFSARRIGTAFRETIRRIRPVDCWAPHLICCRGRR